MADKEILISRLFSPGTMFKVTDAVKDNIFPPGSLGFVSHIRGTDDSYQDLAKMLAIMIRKGKSGKNRIAYTTLVVPVFHIDHKGFNKLLPEEGTKKCYVHVAPELPTATNVMEMPAMHFLGHAVAVAKWIRYMSDQCKHKKWPEKKSHPINAMKRMPDYFEEDPDLLVEKFTTPEFRDQFMKEARRMVSSLVRMQLQLDITRADVEVNASEFLIFTNKGEFLPKDAKDKEKENEYKFTDDDTMLRRTLTFYKKRKTDVETLLKNKKNNN